MAMEVDEDRQRHEDNMMKICKSKREESLQKKRREGLQATHQQSFSSPLHAFATTTVKKKLESLPLKVSGVWSTDSNLQLEATTQFQKLFSIERSPPIEEVIQSGVVPRFAEKPKLEMEELTKFLEYHVEVDPEKAEELDQTKKTENYVTRILKLVKDEVECRKYGITKDPKKESELVGLVENFYKRYKSLYSMYDHLRRDLDTGLHGREEENFPLSPSSSDSEYYSSDEIDGNNGKLENENQELATEEFEVADPNHKLSSTEAKKEYLNSDHMAAMCKIQEAEQINKNLRVEADQRERELLAIVKEYEEHKTQASGRIREFKSQLTGLKFEVESLQDQKRNMKAHIQSKATEATQLIETNIGLHARILQLEFLLKDKGDEVASLLEKLKDSENYSSLKIADLIEEKEGLHARNLELESALTERGHVISALQKKYKIKENEASTQFMTLSAQINNLQQDLDSLQTRKSQLEFQIERDKQESCQRLTLAESQNYELISKFGDEKRTLKEQESTKNEKSLHFAERKIEELAERFRNNIEDNIRLLCQRVLIIEHLHTENKDNYRMTKERYEQEIRVLEAKTATYGAEITKMRAIVVAANNTLSISDLVVNKLEVDNINVLNRINKMSNEIQHAKEWVTQRNKEMKALKVYRDCLVARLDDKVEQELLLREKVWNLEAKENKEVEQKLNLKKAISQLKKKVEELKKSIKEKDEELLNLGEEKREAIRQLCVLIDYQYSRYDHLKNLMSKMTARGGTRT
ncbi:uncharacterized protein LOC142611993 [Castanea sativa]|uniref:uncharacterized protein LOC142611993 n=1 Tax=Castanea sativa TaxID=21020 RepID=UPI003F64A676